MPFPFERLLDWDSVPGLWLGLAAAPALVVLRGRRRAWLVALLGVGACLVQAARPLADSGMVDVRIYVGSAGEWLAGRTLYGFEDPTFGLSATYPPIGVLPFAALHPLGERIAVIVWAAVNVALLAWCCRLVARRLLGLRGDSATTWTLWAVGLSALTVPVWLTIAYQGQVNLVLWALVLGDVARIGRGSRWTGVGTGLATAAKLVPGLFIPWLAVIGERRAAVRAAAVAVAATAVGWALAPDDSRRYWTELLWDTSRVGEVTDPANNSLLAAIGRAVPVGSARTVLWLGGAGIVVVLALVRARRATLAGDLLTAAVVVGCATSLVSPISWTHHLGFLVLALAALAPGGGRPSRPVLLGLGWLALVDPLGFGTDASTSTLRTLAMVALVVAMPVVPDRSRPAEPAPGVTGAAGSNGPTGSSGSTGSSSALAP